MTRKLYEVLGIEETASQEDVRRAYRKLAKKLHPDLNPGDKHAEEKFKAISSAFSILGDEEKRKKYDAGEIDESGTETPQQQYYRHYADTDAHHHYSSTAGFDDFIDISDLFADAFAKAGNRRSGAKAHSMPLQGADVRYHLAVDFLEAVTGAKKRVTMPDGAALNISIPAGIEDGQTMRLKGKGHPGLKGGEPGDALVTVEVRPHPYFERDGNDVLIEIPIALHEAVLGGTVTVPTISGPVNMKVPKGASSGQVLRLRGKGIKGSKRTGDQLVRLKIVMPETIDPELETFMKNWAKDHQYNPRDRLEFTP